MSNEEVMIPKSYHDKVCEEIIRFKDKQFYDAVHLLDDGTLEITVGDCTKVKRVLVEDDNNFGNLFYEDADRRQGEWIPCSERFPSESGYYLCCNNGYLPYVGHFINGRWSDFDCTIVHADAWMPLPKPYGEREGE